MEHRIIKPEKDFKAQSQAKKPEHQLPYKDDENDKRQHLLAAFYLFRSLHVNDRFKLCF